MIDYMNAMVYNFNTNLNTNNITLYPETGFVFAVGESEKLRKNKYQQFYTVVT